MIYAKLARISPAIYLSLKWIICNSLCGKVVLPFVCDLIVFVLPHAYELIQLSCQLLGLDLLLLELNLAVYFCLLVVGGCNNFTRV